jgi:predicted nucleic acid-binding protein
MNKTYVLDANAVLDFTEDGPGAARVEQLMLEAHSSSIRLLISVANWGEVFYHSWQQFGEEEAHRTMGRLARLPIQTVPVDREQAIRAGEIKAVHKIPYVDCIAAALALLNQAVLVTSDRDFEKLGRRIQVLWLARP